MLDRRQLGDAAIDQRDQFFAQAAGISDRAMQQRIEMLGIGLVEAEVRAQNDEGIEAKLINPGSPPGIPAPTVTVPRSGAVSQADRQARQLNNVNTVWTLAGAINFLQVNATITA